MARLEFDEGTRFYDEANGREVIIRRSNFGYYDCLCVEPMITDDGIETEKLYTQPFYRRELEQMRRISK